MGGIRCAKEIIDNMAALVHQMKCTENTIVEYRDQFNVEPTQDQVKEFISRTEAVAKYCQEILDYLEQQKAI